MKKNSHNFSISKSIKLKEIESIASKWGLGRKDIELFGPYKAKISLSAVKRSFAKKKGRYILVTASTPTKLGEGKTSNTIGLSLALNRLKKKSVCCIRQPSLGPLFGIKGAASGGGYAQVLPLEDFNLHLTGDTHAVGTAHNLLGAFLDNSVYFGNKFNINPDKIFWKRVLDISDRSLRKIRVNLGAGGLERETGFDITVAGEVMSILSLSKDEEDLKGRLRKIAAAADFDNKLVTAGDLRVSGAMAVLLRDALKPNLLQTTEHTPCIVHGGCFANISIGTNSVIADYLALGMSEYCVTESGFGADCGAEKFFDIKCRQSGLVPDAAVLVCSIRALKVHSGKYKIDSKNLYNRDAEAVRLGCANLQKQIENVKLFGVPVIVAINKFSKDTLKEIEVVRNEALKAGAEAAVVSEVYSKGGAGAEVLAEEVMRVCEKVKSGFRFLYKKEEPVTAKIEKIAVSIYGAGRVVYSQEAMNSIEDLNSWGMSNLPVCMAKTHLSLSADSKLIGCPSGFALTVDRIYLSAGAGFITAVCGNINTMPALPKNPIGVKVVLKKDGSISGLF